MKPSGVSSPRNRLDCSSRARLFVAFECLARPKQASSSSLQARRASKCTSWHTLPACDSTTYKLAAQASASEKQVHRKAARASTVKSNLIKIKPFVQ